MKESISNNIPQTEAEAPAPAEENASGDIFSILESAETSESSAPDDVYSILGSAETSFVPEPSADPSDPASGALPGFPRFSSRTKNILLAVLPALFLALLLFPFLSGIDGQPAPPRALQRGVLLLGKHKFLQRLCARGEGGETK